METLFWICFGLIVYTYLGYPLFITILGLLRKKGVRRDASLLPTVTFVIPAHNEEKIIQRKLDNTLSIDYPRNLMEIVVVSDASSDNTDEIVRQYENLGVKLVRLTKRGGKSKALNEIVPTASGEIVVLCDANVMFQEQAVRNLVRNFADAEVGCVCGRKIYRDTRSMATAKAERLYWKLEEYLKRCESMSGSVAGADGAIYAIRKKLYVPFDEMLIDDLLISLNVFEQGYRLISDPEALAFESAATFAGEEYSRKNRIVALAIKTLVRHHRFLDPSKTGLMAWRIWSHKVIRWMVPFFLIISAISLISLATQGKYLWFGAAALTLVIAAAIGASLEMRGRKSRLFSLPFYFFLVNTAALIGWMKYLTGRVETTWNKAESSRV